MVTLNDYMVARLDIVQNHIQKCYALAFDKRFFLRQCQCKIEKFGMPLYKKGALNFNKIGLIVGAFLA